MRNFEKNICMNTELTEFLNGLKQAFENKTLVKATLGKTRGKSQELKNIYIRPIELKDGIKLSFTYRYETRDEVKNYDLNEAIEESLKYLGHSLMRMHLFATNQDLEITINKKGGGFLRKGEPSFKKAVIQCHDHQKKQFVNIQAEYLKQLEITNDLNKLRKGKSDKFKQINKYIEIVDGLINKLPSKKLRIVDMGSGKGYLTFALYDYLKNSQEMDVEMTGIELRPNLTEICNDIALKSGFKKLTFKEGSIQNEELSDIDVLIALHACDTATDDAIYKGIQAGASLIICSPCCHKQIRRQMKVDTELNPILKYGIHVERQAEMITDTIRALILELNGYESNVFEFISSEHTGKNLMIAATKSEKATDKDKIQSKVDSLKAQYGIESHYLEILFSKLIIK